MRVIITGGTGLIGRALAEDMAKDGHEVILLSRGAQLPAGLPPGIRLEKWDGSSSQGWGELADGADAIVNLAGENLSAGRWTPQRKQAILESRVHAGAAVVQAVREAAVKPKVVIQASAVGYYGPSATANFSEGDEPAEDFMSDVCQSWEASTEPVEELEVRRVIVRMGVVLSRASGALPRMLLPFKFFAGGPIGSGQQWLPWVHLEDEVRALRFLIDTPQAQGAYNLSAAPLTNRQFAQAIGRVMHRPAFIPVPAFVLRLAFGEMSTVLLEGQRVSAKRLLDLGFQFRFPDADSALQDLVGKK